MKSMADQTHLFSFGQITSVLTFQQIVFRIFYEREFGLVFTSDEPWKKYLGTHIRVSQTNVVFVVYVVYGTP